MDAVVTLVVLALVFLGAVTLVRKLMSLLPGGREDAPQAPAPGPSDFSRDQQLEAYLGDTGRQLAAELGETGVLTVDWLERNPTFRAAVAAVALEPGATLLRLARNPNRWVSYAALAATAQAPEMPAEFTDWSLRIVKSTDRIQDTFIFRSLVRHASRPVIGSALAKVGEGVSKETLARFVGERRAGGEPFHAETLRENLPLDQADGVAEMIAEYEELLGPDFRAIFEAWRAGAVDTAFLEGFGKLWTRPYDLPPVLLTGRRIDIAQAIAEELTSQPRQSILLVGEHGVGKTAVLRAALDRIDEELIVFESTAAQLNAGASFVGELEGRVKGLVERARGKPMIWHLPGLEEALWAGQHSRNPRGLLDAVLPAVAAGELTIVGEVTPQNAERLLAERPQVAAVFQLIQLRPVEEDEAVAIAAHMLEHDGHDIAASDETLRSAYELAQQFLPRTAAPGNMLRLLRAAVDDAVEAGAADLERALLIEALAHSSGLPLAMLDASTPLRLDDVRAFFDERVLGQAQAIDALVERIAMIKAGVTDPTRPLGVFFFVGPTGTGKTEIAKAFATFLFGAADRMVRLDMSEYRTPEALERLLSDTSLDSHGAPLISSIRKNPFSVILLDEFEKATPPIWDVFLQVFDDGRLTDLHGGTVDLRRCVIILTSNVGSSIATRERIGFTTAPEPFRPEAVARELEHWFRPEFLNRLDRVVVFRPFERSQMRALLDKELGDALTRRGLRERPWAVELDDSAYEFLIDHGFSPALGARPLKRALERYLLAPLAAAIVEHTTPSGDQFLLVTAPGGERIDVTFVDPDAGDDKPLPDRDPGAALGEPSDLRSLALAPRAGPAATAFLLAELQRIVAAVRFNGVQGRKAHALAAMQREGFWEDDGRYAVLSEIEYLDRLETALETTERLGERLARNRDDDRGTRLHGLVAGRLYVLDQAIGGLDDDAPTDVYLRIRLAGEAAGAADPDFTAMLVQMYTGWAAGRGMRLEVLDTGAAEHVLRIGGLGCGAILADEAGLHVFEPVEKTDDGTRSSDRINATVEVVACGPGPQATAGDRLDEARRALLEEPVRAAVVRRYRAKPDPLVRDAARGYRTGRLDEVLAGNFDLF